MSILTRCCKSVAKRATAVVLFAGVSCAQALVTVPLEDGASATARISIKDPTRVRVEGARITDVIGSEVHSPDNPAGRLAVRADEHGAIYLQPTDPAMPATSLFVTTETATYTLVLAPAAIPADTVLIQPQGTPTTSLPMDGAVRAVHDARLPNYEKALIELLREIASDRVPPYLSVVEHNTPVALWEETRFHLLREYKGHPRWRIEAFMLTNITNQNLVIDEREFITRGVVAVALEQADLAPGQATLVRIVRGEQP